MNIIFKITNSENKYGIKKNVEFEELKEKIRRVKKKFK